MLARYADVPRTSFYVQEESICIISFIVVKPKCLLNLATLHHRSECTDEGRRPVIQLIPQRLFVLQLLFSRPAWMSLNISPWIESHDLILLLPALAKPLEESVAHS